MNEILLKVALNTRTITPNKGSNNLVNTESNGCKLTLTNKWTKLSESPLSIKQNKKCST